MHLKIAVLKTKQKNPPTQKKPGVCGGEGLQIFPLKPILSMISNTQIETTSVL